MSATELEALITDLEQLHSVELDPVDWAMIHAADAGDLEKVRACLAAGANVHARGVASATALLCAAAGDNAEVCVALYLAGSDPQARTDHGMTLIHFAAKSKNIEMMLAATVMGVSLLPNGNWPNVPGQFRTQKLTLAATQAPLMAAVRLGIPALILHVLDRDPSISDAEVRRGIASAAKAGANREPVVAMLRSWRARKQAVAALCDVTGMDVAPACKGRAP